MAGKFIREVTVEPYNPRWREMAAAESTLIRNALGDTVLDIVHIGSTSVPGLSAKPIIDFLVIVENLSVADERAGGLEKFGYVPMGEYGLPGRRFFKKGETPRTHHIHLYQRDSVFEIERHLAVPEYLSAHPDAAEVYGALKTELAGRFRTDIEGYMDGKNAFVRDLEARALAWRKANGTDYRI